MERAQGAMEYLLLIGGGVLVTVIIILILLSSSQNADFIGSNLGLYQDSLDDATLGPPPDDDPSDPGTPPNVALFDVFPTAIPFTLMVNYSVDNLAVDSFIKVKGWKVEDDPGLLGNQAAFDGASGNEYYFETLIPTLPVSASTFPITLSLGNQEYVFYILSCNPIDLCDVGGPVSAITLDVVIPSEYPSIISFASDPLLTAPTVGPLAGGVTFYFSIQDLQAGAGVTIKGWGPGNVPATIMESNFDSLPSDDYFYQESTGAGTFAKTFVDYLPEANKNYIFYLLACNPGNKCTLSSSDNATTPTGTPNGTITTQLGTIEIVFDWTNDKCDDMDLPDMPTRAIQEGGELLVSRSNIENRWFKGTNFNNLVANCNVILPLTGLPDTISPAIVPQPGLFAHKEWINTVYKAPGESRIHMLIHNEFHDPWGASDPPCDAGNTIPGNPCNYFSITYAYSDDGGNNFVKHPFSATNQNQHLVGASHLQWEDDVTSPAPVFGLPRTTNIVRKGSYYYFITHALQAVHNTNSTNGACIARTQNLNDPSSWRFWDGDSYSIRMGSPYILGDSPPSGCAFISKTQIQNMSHSLTWNKYLKKFLLISNQNLPGPICGFMFSTSDDLITWTQRQMLWNVPLTTPPCPVPPSNQKAYPTIIDHAQLGDVTDPSFEISGKTPFLYYTNLIDGFDDLDRDLERRLLTFCDTAIEGTCPPSTS